ncbi:MAG: regulatory protein RecX [Bacteroidales bacterium]|nr:regulatory protein RecX [Bacteroidales bacterium]MBR5028712.1 regulatory protein RecX [Bacteroidales bacterium]
MTNASKQKTEDGIIDMVLIRAKIQAYCSRAEQCEWSVRRKLAEWRVPASDAEDFVAELIADGFIDERRYASAFVHDRLRFGHCGRNKIRFELRQKQISDKVVSEALASIDEDEYLDILQLVAESKKRSLKGLEPAVQQRRLQSFLLSRGFEMEYIIRYNKK